MTKPFKRILMTGAAGGLGQRLRPHLGQFADIVRLADIADLGPAGPGEETVRCDLAERDQVLAMCEGVDAILHFGGVSTEVEFAPIMQANILGMANLYEAVHKLGIRRVVFASSNHTMGMYKTTDTVDATMPPRADGYYGLSKVFGESLSRYYWDRFGIETVCIRIGYCFPEATNHRQLATWLSLDDLVQLLRRSLLTPRVGHTVTFGISDNDGKWWDARHSRFLGYAPKDSSAQFADQVYAGQVDWRDPDDITLVYQGGVFLNNGPKYKP
ncbi:NAD(P)-dependent oxidoreductase [Massilia forsythiae]|uniref:NAD(P)-dependent oxidoreductase n=1 Tax=Massilia forsythiae TaxID=2728020 RepID=A0A7Z2VYU5_9BURK|nr:NAD(P)-dependent oxidoreductase [Massilia forsythiae]QJE01921.1 NAD(P)-dependent oxidoreductase [Massilia forsythiae]